MPNRHSPKLQHAYRRGRLLMFLRMTSALLLATICMTGTTALADEVPGWAQNMIDEWYEAYNARDSKRLADLHSVDARVGQAVGPDQIAARFETGWAENDNTCTGTFTGFRVVGEIASGWGEDVCQLRDGSGETSKVEWIVVYERQPGGRWLTIRDFGQPMME